MDDISEERYETEVEDIAERLVSGAEDMVERDQFDDPDQAVMETVSDELDYHNWFARNYYDGALYGSIVEHGSTDPAYYSDWQALIESDDPETTLKRLAYAVMEGDVLEAALEQLDDD